MITIFTVPKAFTGNIAVNQENAIRSWQRLKPKPEIIIFGNDPGVAAAARRLKVKHVPQIKRNKYGTPLLGSIFREADRRAKNDTLCYINTDIIILNNFLPKIRRVPFKKFLIIGRRYDMKVDYPIDFRDKEWNKKMHNELLRKGSFFTMGMDYFIYRNGLYKDMPEFAIGRGSWDSWLVHSAIQQKAAVIDASSVILALHENHDYSHLKTSPKFQYWKGVEGEKNLALSGFRKVRPPNFYDAQHILTKDGINPARGIIYLGQRAYDFSTRHKALFPLYLTLKMARKLSPLVHKFKKPKTQ